MKNRRFISIVIALLAVILVAGAFAACSSEPETITTDPAVVKNQDSVNLIKSYSTEELGLSGTWDDYDFVAHNNSGVQVQDGVHDGYYIEVQVGKKVEHSDGSITIANAAYYLISYDGETILKYDPENETYTPLSELQSTESETETASQQNAETESEAQ